MNETPSLFKRTRLAPTPSGFLHLGNVLSFAITAALAEKTNAKILLRIDDLDRERVNKDYVQDIFDTLNFLEIPWHEGPKNMQEYENEYSQQHRVELYEKALLQLKETGNVFACTCSRTQIRSINNDDVYPGTCRNKNIPLDNENVSWRLRTSPLNTLSIKTYPHTIVQTTLPGTMQDFIVRKKDGFAAYQLASVADDVYYGVDMIVRGEDLWDSTVAQHYLAQQLNANTFLSCTFYHHPLLMEQGDIKLSKSAGATSVQYLRKQGKKPADIYNIIAGMMGMKTPVNSWQELGNAFLIYL